MLQNLSKTLSVIIILYTFHHHSDIQKIEEGIGRNFANFIQELVSLLASFMIALAYNWKLTLVTSVFLPVLLIVLGVVGKVR